MRKHFNRKREVMKAVSGTRWDGTVVNVRCINEPCGLGVNVGQHRPRWNSGVDVGN